MKRSLFLLPLLFMLSLTSLSHGFTDQDFDAKLNALQDFLSDVIEQSNIDPQTAQELLEKTNELNMFVQHNIQQNAQEIRIASAITSILETVDSMAQSYKMTQVHSILKNVKYAARANVIQKLLAGMYPEKFSDDMYYTNPYLESVGFICNDWAFNTLFAALLTAIAPTSLGSALKLNPASNPQKAISRIAAGITAYCAWMFEKKSAFMQLAAQ